MGFQIHKICLSFMENLKEKRLKKFGKLAKYSTFYENHVGRGQEFSSLDFQNQVFSPKLF